MAASSSTVTVTYARPSTPGGLTACRPQPVRAARRGHGFTLIELLVAVAVAAILVTIGIPGFQSLVAKSRLKGAAEEAHAHFQLAKSEAIKRREDVYVSFVRNAPQDWCYGLSQGSQCDCSAAGTDCQLDGVDQVVDSSQHPHVNLTSASFAGNTYVAFDHVYATAQDANDVEIDQDGTVSFTSDHGHAANVIVSTLGSVKLCSPSGGTNIWDYPAC